MANITELQPGGDRYNYTGENETTTETVKRYPDEAM